MVSFTSTILATIAIVSVAQAGPIAAVVRGVSTVASVASSISNSKHHRDLIRGESSIFQRDDAAVQGNFASCVSALHAKGAKKVVVTHKEGAVHLQPMPKECIVGINNYNKMPNVGTLNAAHGSAHVVGADAVELKDMPEEFVKMLE